MLQMCENCGWLCPCLEDKDIDEEHFMLVCRKCKHKTPLDKPRAERMVVFSHKRRREDESNK